MTGSSVDLYSGGEVLLWMAMIATCHRGPDLDQLIGLWCEAGEDHETTEAERPEEGRAGWQTLRGTTRPGDHNMHQNQAHSGLLLLRNMTQMDTSRLRRSLVAPAAQPRRGACPPLPGDGLPLHGHVGSADPFQRRTLEDQKLQL